MALIRGVGSNVPCPRCLIPHDQLGNHLTKAALRTTAGTKASLREARGKRFATDSEEFLKAAGLRDADVRPLSYYYGFEPSLTTLRRTYSGRSTTRTHMPRYLSIGSILSPVACSGITCGGITLNHAWKHWVGTRVLRLTRCM